MIWHWDFSLLGKQIHSFTARIHSYALIQSNAKPSKGVRSFWLRPSSDSFLIFQLLRGGRRTVLHCAQLSHPPTHWQIFFTRPTLRLLRNRFPETCH